MEQNEQKSVFTLIKDRILPGFRLPSQERLSQREQAVTASIRQIQTPFLELLQEQYGTEKGWQLCGPAAIALSRILSSKLGIPIARDGEGEHIELYLGIYNPGTDVGTGEEHTFIKYFSGNGSVLYIDPIYRLLTNKTTDISDDPILVEKFAQDKFDQQLAKRHNIYPFDPNNNMVRSRGGMTSAEQINSFWQDVMAAMHDYRATMPILVGADEKKRQTNWAKATAIIQKFAPDWQEDIRSQSQDYSRLLTTLDPRTPVRPMSDSEKMKLIEKRKDRF